MSLLRVLACAALATGIAGCVASLSDRGLVPRARSAPPATLHRTTLVLSVPQFSEVQLAAQAALTGAKVGFGASCGTGWCGLLVSNEHVPAALDALGRDARFRSWTSPLLRSVMRQNDGHDLRLRLAAQDHYDPEDDIRRFRCELLREETSVLVWQTNRSEAFAVSEGVLVRVLNSRTSREREPGTEVFAVDIESGRELWSVVLHPQGEVDIAGFSTGVIELTDVRRGRWMLSLASGLPASPAESAR